ncbi:MAG: Type IV pilus assembly protein PilM [Candidatus Moranbacteria bacterium GW2011_GWA2_39_41]|nr:MAG: Type IV pilus assembly protein PilM [Candidatus Moranbacteria bacterium GW2011_GWA2_39_41]
MFGFGSKRFIGIDIGSSNVKIVELKIIDNKPVLTNYAWVHVRDFMVGGDLKAVYSDTILPEYIRRMLKESKMIGKEAYFSIPAFSGLITLIEFPNIIKEDLEQAIKFEAHKYVPLSLEDTILNWDIISKESVGEAVDRKDVSANDKMQVLLVAAPKSKVDKYEKLAINANLQLKSIEIESFSLVRALVGNDQGNFVIVDIGSRVCNIIIVEKGVIKANRNIDAGGRDISRTIARSMNISDNRAIALKTSGKNFLNTESSINFPVIDLIVGEVSRVLNSYYKNNAKSDVDGVIISGGTAGFVGIDEYLTKELGIKTTIGNPFSRVEYDQRITMKIKEIGNQFAVAIGLALGGVDEYLKK